MHTSAFCPLGSIAKLLCAKLAVEICTISHSISANSQLAKARPRYFIVSNQKNELCIIQDLQRLNFLSCREEPNKEFEFWLQQGHRMKSPRLNFQGRDEAAEFTAGISSLSDAITPVGTEIWAPAPPPRAVRGWWGGGGKDTAERLLEAHYSLSLAR